jgi:GNAT superfamily N-acetyltransferase
MADREIIDRPEAVKRYISQVAAAADGNRDALGFLPDSAYEELAAQGKLWVAVSRDEYAGHLAFGGTYPNLRVFQLHVSPSHRRGGLGFQLIRRLVEYGEKNNYLSIVANVASDLSANAFWERSGFLLVRVKAGGATRGRTINVRVRQLQSPTLFSTTSPESGGGGPTIEQLRFPGLPINRNGAYALDLNVILDVVQRRVNREDAGRVLGAAMHGELALCVTREFVAELERNTSAFGSDPLLEFARTLPTLPIVDEVVLARLVVELGRIVFTTMISTGSRATRRRSDLRHLAHSIHHRLRGFVTRDGDILGARTEIQERFGLDVVAPADLASAFATTVPTFPPTYSVGAAGELRLSEFRDADLANVEVFLSDAGFLSAVASEFWAPGTSQRLRQRLCAWQGSALVGVAAGAHPAPASPSATWFLHVDETSRAASLVVDHFVEAALRSFAGVRSGVLDLDISADSAITKEACRRRGFRQTDAQHASPSLARVRKVVFHDILTRSEWQDFVSQVNHWVGLQMPTDLPTVVTCDTTIDVIRPDGRVVPATIFDLETLTGPVLYLFSSDVGAIIPIQARYTAELLGSRQGSFFASKEAKLRTEKAYYRTPAGAARFRRGMPLIFYDSQRGGGDGVAIGCARLTYSGVNTLEQIEVQMQVQGVLSKEELESTAVNGAVHVMAFDNFQAFGQPVTFTRMRKLGAESATNLVSAEVFSVDVIEKICRAGFDRG